MMLPPADTATLLAWAHWYASQGWPVFPCRGKLPRTLHGHKDATTEPRQIAQWWSQWPMANIGCPSGAHWWALDVDPQHGGNDTLWDLQQRHGALPSTLLSHTGGGGTHYLWAPPSAPIQNKAPLGPGLDVQAGGLSYLILPPSLHPETGRAYVWDCVNGPGEIAPQPAPDWLEQLVTSRSVASRSALPSPGAPIPAGTRQTTMARLAGVLRREGLGAEEITQTLLAMNTRCVPPLSYAEIAGIAASIGRYAPAGQLTPSPTPPMPADVPPPPLAPRWPTPVFVDLADMLTRTYPPPVWLIQDLIPEGLTFLVGSPKSGKTYLAYSLLLSLMTATSEDTAWLDTYPVLQPGPAIYLSLEDDEGDSRLRIAELMPQLTSAPAGRCLFLRAAPNFHEGLVEYVRTEICARYHPSLLVLDPLSYLYAPSTKPGDQFTEVKSMLLPLRQLAKDEHCAIVAIDHRRKKSKDDVDIFETLYGSNAKLAIADALLLLVREQEELTLHTRMRKAADQRLALRLAFTNGQAQWTFLGLADALVPTSSYGDLRVRACALLAGRAGTSFTLDGIVQGLGLEDTPACRNTLKQNLLRAQKAREIGKNGRNSYVWTGQGRG